MHAECSCFGAAQIVPGKVPGRPQCQVFLSEDRPGAEARAASAVAPHILQVPLIHSVVLVPIAHKCWCMMVAIQWSHVCRFTASHAQEVPSLCAAHSLSSWSW